MTSAADIAASMNRWVREGLDMMGNSDSDALNLMMDDYFECACKRPLPDGI